MAEWYETALGDVATVTHGYAFEGKYFGKGGAMRLVTPGNFFERGGFRDRGAEQKSYYGPMSNTYRLPPGSLVVAMTEQSSGLLGSSALIPDDGFTWLHNQRIGLVVPRDDLADKNFLMYLLNSQTVRDQINATSTGTKVRHTAPTRIEAVRVPLPGFLLQRRIAALLSSFDKLIEINERRIDLLEALVRSLYQQWIVRFRYPGARNRGLINSAIGSIPRGWSVRTVSDFAEIVTEGVEPSEFLPGVRYVGLKHLARRSTTLQQWGAIDTIKSRKLRFRQGDTLFAKIRPNLQKVAWAPSCGLASSDTLIFRPCGVEPLTAFVNSVLSSDQVMAEATATANGTKMPRANPTVLLGHQIAVPSVDLLGAFEDAVSLWLNWNAQLVEVNDRLGRIRDLLLPRLVSGQLDISDIDLGVLTPTEPE